MAGTDPPPASWDQQFTALPASVAEIRRALTAFARAHGAGAELLGDLQLAVSEAATNAVVHAFVTVEPGTVRVRAQPRAGAFDVIVSDDGHGMVPRGDSPGLGLGLPTIAQLTTRLDIRAGAGGRGTEVHMVFDAPGLEGPPEDPKPALLAEVTRLAGTGWPTEGVERLLELLVPAVADAGAIDLVEASGPQRVAARGTEPPKADPLDTPIATFDTVHIAPTSHDGLAHWVTIPLTESGVVLGTLGLGLAPSRPDPHADVPFFQALGERAARGLASTHLVEELRRTRRRLERILSVLSEAVTVQDVHGRTVYANDAAVELLGASGRDEIVEARPGELAARFDITREDGSPVQHADLPGDRVLAGESEAQLLTRSIRRDTGAERWLLTKATLLEDGEPFAVSIIEDITEAKNAELRRRLRAEVALVLAEVRGRDARLQRIATLAVPALADWCAIDVDGHQVAQHGTSADAPRSTLACPIGDRGTLHLRTTSRLLEDDHRAFAGDLARRLQPALSDPG